MTDQPNTPATSASDITPTEADLARDLPAMLQWLDRIDGDVVLCKVFHIGGYRSALRRAIAAEAELKQLKTGTYCAYCGHTEPIDGDGERIAEHIRTCEKHPMRAVEGRVKELEEILEEHRQCGMDRNLQE